MRMNREVLRTIHVENFYVKCGVPKNIMDKKHIKPDLDVQMDDTTRVAVREGGAQLSSHTQQPAPTLYISFMDKGSRLYTPKHKLTIG
jgi:hypothetical protein